MPTLFRTTAAILSGVLVYLAVNPPTLLRFTVFGFLALTVLIGGWWFGDYIEATETHNLHVTQQWLTVAQQAAHRSDWHYTALDGAELCDFHGPHCPLFQDTGKGAVGNLAGEVNPPVS
jgi:hypothetical protein